MRSYAISSFTLLFICHDESTAFTFYVRQSHFTKPLYRINKFTCYFLTDLLALVFVYEYNIILSCKVEEALPNIGEFLQFWNHLNQTLQCVFVYSSNSRWVGNAIAWVGLSASNSLNVYLIRPKVE